MFERANDTPHMHKLSFINIMYISSKSGHYGSTDYMLLILINISMHMCVCVSVAMNPHHRSHCIYVCNTVVHKHITHHIFHILLRVICNDVSDRLSAVFIAILKFGYYFCKRPLFADDECFINIVYTLRF